MALILVGSGLIASAAPAASFQRRRLVYAASPASQSTADLARTSGAEFFKDETRPIMLFDGKALFEPAVSLPTICLLVFLT